jgi:hypothetical protein
MLLIANGHEYYYQLLCVIESNILLLFSKDSSRWKSIQYNEMQYSMKNRRENVMYNQWPVIVMAIIII